jgi:hypothetical protein
MLKITLCASVFLCSLIATPARADIHIVDDGAKITVDCAKEKIVYVSGDKANITLSGTCDVVNISGDGATVKGSTVQVNISGDDNTFTLDAVDQILLSGNNNTVTYKKTVKAKKTGLISSGKDNKVSQVK